MFDENNTIDVQDSSPSSIPSDAQFWLYFIFLVPSIICTVFLLYHLLFDRNLRRALNNHVIIVLLITVLFSELTIFPWMLYYLHKNSIWQRSYIFCSIWAYIDWTTYVMQIMLFAWASIERHILIFHDGWVSTKKKRYFIHYLPVIMIIVYYLIFYFFVYIFPFCENTLNNSSMICITTCSFGSIAFHIFESLTNNVIPSLTIVVFSVALLLRILRQKHRMCQAIHWRRHRKMTIQLLSIAFLYLLVTCPYAFIIFLRICGLPKDIGSNFQNYSLFISYYIVLLFPFVSIFSLPELYHKIKVIFHIRRPTRTVNPQILAMTRVRRNRDVLGAVE